MFKSELIFKYNLDNIIPIIFINGHYLNGNKKDRNCKKS